MVKKTRYWKEYWWIISFIKPYKGTMFLLISCGVIISLTAMLIPRSIQFFIDRILPAQDLTLFLYMLLLLLAVLSVMILATGGKNLLQRIVREKAAKDLQHTAFSHLRKLGFSYFEQNSTGQTLSLLNTDVQDVQRIYRDYFPQIVLQSITCVIAFFIIASMNLVLSLIIIPCFLVYYIAGPWVERQAFLYLRSFNEHRVDVEKDIYETMSSMQEARAYRLEAWIRKRFIERLGHMNKDWLKSIIFAHTRGSIRRLTIYLAILILFVYGSHLVRVGVLSLGEFIAYYFYFFIVMNALTHLVTATTEQHTLMFQAKRLYDFCHLKPDVVESSNPKDLRFIKGSITVQHIHFSYPTYPNALKGVSFQILPGEHVALVGESGCGKTTLLKLLGRFYDMSKGQIFIDAIPIQELSLSSLRSNIGYVFQETYLFGTTIRENIAFGHPEASEEDIVEAAKLAFAHEFIMELPKGYDTLVGERGYKLSGGQKQRISIARMFIKNPAIVLLDEATSALDNISEAHVQQALEKLTQGRTTITIAHRLSTVQNCDKIIVMDKGRVVEEGTYDQLLQRKEGLYRLVHGQTVSVEEEVRA
ncbi:ABC transporter ATP-binding protein [Bacillus horti]|uniref:ATP-binding cassette subfamily B protein/subfamily B ATP-binding cassette protein MsbA n=1 Tax=Caldalkalibacillus horti TaxID=77523 RepID=A0ABT9W3C7_9BACI|nr:ABC transporter ATP-binding protein [Bacillus horti]MDQ0167748.1 ATP-binding cassette subfamily B protein/subfamily B ATP-binding cassette protein MsbA [Bacillus horti]